MARHRSPGAHATGAAGGVPTPAYVPDSYAAAASQNGRFDDDGAPLARRAVRSAPGDGRVTLAARSAGRRTHRHRYALRPWLVLASLAAVGLVLHLIPLTRALWWIFLIVGLAYTVLAQYRRKGAPGNHRGYAVACALAGTFWLSIVIASGPVHGIGRIAVFTIAVPGLWPLCWWWWQYHRVRPVDHSVATPRLPDPILAAWDAHVGGPKGVLPGARLVPRRASAGTREYLIVGVRGHHTTKQLTTDETLHKLASALAIDPDTLVLERPPKGPDRSGPNARLLIVTAQNEQLETSVPWHGPTLDSLTGLYSPAVYADGPAFCRLYVVAEGRPHRALNNAVSGLMNHGKSRFIELKVLEMLWSGIFVVWYGDGQEGASGPGLRDHVDWYATRKDEILRMLKAAFRVAKARQRYDETVTWADRHGHARTGRGFWPASPEEPFLQIILDEVQELLTDIRIAKLVKTLQRLGPKLGIGVTLVTQEWLMYETGGASGDPGAQTIRSFAQTGLVVLFKAGSDINANALGGALAGVNPRTLPDEPGWCFLLGQETRQSRARTRHVDPDDIYDWLARASGVKARLDDLSVRAAGDDYRERWQRLGALPTADSEEAFEDIEKDLDALLNGGSQGQALAKAALVGLPLKQAVLDVVRARGPIKRADIDAALAEGGRVASKSTIDQALASFARTSTIVSLGNGLWDLPDRADHADADAEERAATLEPSGQ
jgi:hypothetical protein